jgi:hypothetical protein
MAVPSSEADSAVNSAITPPRTNVSAASGPARATAVPGRTKIPAPIIVPIPIVSAASGPRSFASSSSPLTADHLGRL